jgi:hypothetical protein
MTAYWIFKDFNSQNERGDRKEVTHTTSVFKSDTIRTLKKCTITRKNPGRVVQDMMRCTRSVHS